MNKKVRKVSEDFADSIRNTEEYKRYVKAKENFESDEESIQLLKKLDRERGELLKSNITLDEYKKTENKVKDNINIQEMARAERDFFSLIRETNDYLSNEIGAHFAYAEGGGRCG